ncbi:FKBP-type peptidyl-prolyl cis-trans isomerase [Sphingomonas daechungensis]|uniref:FKBP-type peptidyl-prolyl cis-trans isomerase n=1 Tax=Sphingomonas daechungensis TaxID=1176646 RepID=UPI003784E396
MSVAEAAKRPEHRGRAAGIWIALIVLVAAGIGLAWLGASPLRGTTTESGLRIRTLQAGEGPFIQSVDGVMVEYEGRLADGTVFDDSARHGGPQPMIAGQVIPGFAEALTKMQKGGKYKIHIPGKLAYGETPPPGSPFGPNADLDFDVHIVQIVPNAALMQQQQQGIPDGGQAEPQRVPVPEPGQPQP